MFPSIGFPKIPTPLVNLSNNAPPVLVREVLTTARTYYVRPDGNDINDGLENTATRAFLTPQAAMNHVARSLDLKQFSVTIQLADGTYSASISYPNYVGGGVVIIKGNTTTPANVVLTTTGSAIFINTSQRVYRIQDVKLTGSAVTYGLYAQDGGAISFGNIDFGTGITYQIFAAQNGQVYNYSTNYTISGSCANHVLAQQGSNVLVYGVTLTLTNTPAFTNAFLHGTMGSSLTFGGNTYSGASTGPRFIIEYNSNLRVDGASGSLPGNTGGVTNNGGEYN